MIEQQARSLNPAEDEPSSRRPPVLWGRVPALAAAGAMASGIVLQEIFGLGVCFAGALGVLVCLIAWRVSLQRKHVAFGGDLSGFGPGFFVTGALLALASAAGLWHEATWNWTSRDSLSRLADLRSQGVCLEGICRSTVLVERMHSSFAKSSPVAMVASGSTPAEATNDGPGSDRVANGEAAGQRVISRFVFSVERLVVGPEHRQVSGDVQVDVEGETRIFQPGDRLRIYGKLSRPAPPMNPGEFNYADWLYAQGIVGHVRVKHPEAVVQTSDRIPVSWRLRRWMSWLRQRGERSLEQVIVRSSPELASSILLGGRQRLDADLRESFVRSGLLHILAVSGMNVGLVVLLMMTLSKGIIRHPWKLAACGLGTIALFLMLAENDPPVVRAAFFGSAWILGSRWAGVVEPLNVLGLTAVTLMILSPHDLLQLGFQLSFLAVATLLIVARTMGKPQVIQSQSEGAMAASGWRAIRGHRWLAILWQLMIATFVIWCLTTPLIAATSGVISPVGLILNIALAPLVPIILWSGYITLLLGMIHPWLAIPSGGIFDWSLYWLIDVVDQAAGWRYGHFVLSPLPVEYALIFYSAVAGMLLFRVHRVRVVMLTLGLGVIWLAVGYWPQERPLRLTFLSVGHGLAVLVETPDQKMWLYDAGSLGQDRRAARVIGQAIRHYGSIQLDAVTISHADADHANAIPRLTRDVTIRWLGMPKSAADPDQRVIGEAVAAVASQGGVIRLVQGGQKFCLSQDVEIEFLWPLFKKEETLLSRKTTDNSESLVARITYQNRVILLTGDLEGEGLVHLLETPPGMVDVLLAPHHGGKRSNVAALNHWARPQHVISSQGPGDVTTGLEQTFVDSKIWVTSKQGAIVVEIDRAGVVTVRSQLP
ncbi:ComEC/Rec2-related protein [Planctopirus limnophila DSM 3776]|uniref:ComEC/Rec2-related protein n=1 Tax=Planctopirus limnophila (strain ATCC 43296 / DSM 3776 / IFAM 1008 / Mu 290) TaxID=521674 RepID=D5SPF6_PLAL2|nr:ComEC/Rec2 family competence protein [Planctopirus limnophila]ADG68300.1 ComEC/Rec2-related protein [Planctopirus limnophila DSM 3776]